VGDKIPSFHFFMGWRERPFGQSSKVLAGLGLHVTALHRPAVDFVCTTPIMTNLVTRKISISGKYLKKWNFEKKKMGLRFPLASALMPRKYTHCA